MSLPEIPREPVLDKLLGVTVTLDGDSDGCTYAGYEFGANYPDSVCINGYLWDADSGDADPHGNGWIYTNGGDIPCPWCNHAAWVDGALEGLRDDGFQRDRDRDACPHPEKTRFEYLGEAFREAWLRGWDEGGEE